MRESADRMISRTLTEMRERHAARGTVQITLRIDAGEEPDSTGSGWMPAVDWEVSGGAEESGSCAAAEALMDGGTWYFGGPWSGGEPPQNGEPQDEEDSPQTEDPPQNGEEPGGGETHEPPAGGHTENQGSGDGGTAGPDDSEVPDAEPDDSGDGQDSPDDGGGQAGPEDGGTDAEPGGSGHEQNGQEEEPDDGGPDEEPDDGGPEPPAPEDPPVQEDRGSREYRMLRRFAGMTLWIGYTDGWPAARTVAGGQTVLSADPAQMEEDADLTRGVYCSADVLKRHRGHKCACTEEKVSGTDAVMIRSAEDRDILLMRLADGE